MKEIKVSVIVPVYNTEKYLEQCLDSIVAQTLKEIEIICVDDGSTDSSLDILKKYASKDERIVVLQQENGGAGAARNNGLAIAKGKYCSFLDADDFFEAAMLQEAYQKAEEDSADIVVFDSNQYWEDLDEYKKVNWVLRMSEVPPYTPFTHRQMTSNVFKVFVGWAWDKLFRREFITEHNLTFQEQRTSNDMLFVFRAIVLAKKITIVNKVLACQRRDSQESLSKTREKSWQCFYQALSALQQSLVKDDLYWELERDFINYALHACLWNLNTISEPTYSVLKKKLCDEWFEDLQIKGKDEKYFYNKNEYKQYCKLVGIK